MKGPAATQSDNLNPWHWKKERAARHKNTAPATQASENTFEKADALESDYVLVPVASVDKLKDYIPLDRLTIKKILEQNPALHASINQQDRAEAKQNIAQTLQPLTKTAELLAPDVSRCNPSHSNVLSPIASSDKLEGYEAQYFLKEDGKDDVP